MRLLIATTNRHKVVEIRRILGDLGIEFLSLDRRNGVEPPAETGASFEENARAKAAYYTNATGELTVAEDSGLEIEALSGAPGVESARYGGESTSYPEKFTLIYSALQKVRGDGSPARFVCALALAAPGRIMFEARGTVEGYIAAEPRGLNGFGYDPIFFYPPYRRTLGEMAPEEKAEVSHRGKAFRKLREYLESLKSEV